MKFLLLLLVGLQAGAQTPPLKWSIPFFIQELESQKYSTIEAAFQSVPDEIRGSYVPMYESHGLRGASFQSPSILMFSSDGLSYLTLGDRTLAKGNSIELAHFNTLTKKIELSEVVFENEGLPNYKVNVIRNPGECQACHGIDSKLIFQSYNALPSNTLPLGTDVTYNGKHEVRAWLGSYGSFDDSIRTTAAVPAIEKTEAAEYKKFVNNITKDTRYNVLLPPSAITNEKDLNGKYKAYPLLLPKVLNPNLIYRPNLRLTSLVSVLSSQRTYGRMLNHPHFDKFKYLAMYSFMECAKDDVLTSAEHAKIASDVVAVLTEKQIHTGIDLSFEIANPFSVRAGLALFDLTFKDDFSPSILDPHYFKDVFPSWKNGAEVNGVWDKQYDDLYVSQQDRFNAITVMNSVNSGVLYLLSENFKAEPAVAAVMDKKFKYSDAGGSDMWYFEGYPYSLNFFKTLDQFALQFDIAYAKKKGFCQNLIQLQAIK